MSFAITSTEIIQFRIIEHVYERRVTGIVIQLEELSTTSVLQYKCSSTYIIERHFTNIYEQHFTKEALFNHLGATIHTYLPARGGGLKLKEH
jgi:hypothetical protein